MKEFYTIGLDDEGRCNGDVGGPWLSLDEATHMASAGQIITMPVSVLGVRLYTVTRDQLAAAVTAVTMYSSDANRGGVDSAKLADAILTALSEGEGKA